MKAVVAIDSFKGSLSSSQAGKAAADGIIRVYPDAKVEICVLADGGEGTMEALMSGMNGKNQCIFVTDPLGKKTVCEYGIAEDGKTAIMEMASAAGITLIKKEERNPLFTTTYGVGEMILDAIKKGCTKFLIGIGRKCHKRWRRRDASGAGVWIFRSERKSGFIWRAGIGEN